MYFDIKQIASVTMTLFAIIDILAAIPMIISLRQKSGKIESAKASFAAMLLMITFLFLGEELLKVVG
ncbi:MAG: MarC family protein, partial [Chryseobacterium sp.]